MSAAPATLGEVLLASLWFLFVGLCVGFLVGATFVIVMRGAYRAVRPRRRS